MQKLKQKAAAAGTAVSAAMVSTVAAAEESGIDVGEVTSHLEGTVTSNIGTIGTAILIVGGIVYGIGVLRGFLKA